MKTGHKVLLIVAGLLIAVTLYGQSRIYTGPTTPLKAPGSDVPPSIAVSTPSPEEELWDLAYSVDDVLKVKFGGNTAVDIEYDISTVTYNVWLDSLNAYVLDDALTNYTAFQIWHNILDSLPTMCAELERVYANSGRDDVSVNVNVVDFFDFSVLLASANASGVTFDIVERTSPGEKISLNVYADGSAVVDTINGQELIYVANRKSKIFHTTSCSVVDTIDEKNRSFVRTTHNDLIARGYMPCKICNP